MTHRPRLGVHCPGSGVGGPWRYVHSLLRAIDLDRYDVRLFCDIPDLYEPRPAVHVVNLSPGGPPGEVAVLTPRRARTGIPKSARLVAGFTRTAWRFSRLLQSHRLDLFHTQTTGCEEAPVAARLAGIRRVVGTFHVDSGSDWRRERDGLEYRLLERWSNHSLHCGIGVSRATSRHWRRRTFLPSSRSVTIHNGIDAASFERRLSTAEARRLLNIPAQAFVVLGLGRLDAVKGFADLITAAALSKVPDLTIVLAGDGPLRPTLQALAASLGVRLILPGHLHDVNQVFDAADLFALPSHSETFGYALAEAMAAGLPAIGSDVGGVSELLRHEITGLLLPPRDPPAWAAAIRRLAADPATRLRFGEAGHQRVHECFTEADMVSQTFAVYDRLLGLTRRTP